MLEGNAFDAVYQLPLSKIYQQRAFQPCHFQIGECLRHRYLWEIPHSLEFNNHFFGDQQVNPLPFDDMSLVINVYFDLTLKRNSSEP